MRTALLLLVFLITSACATTGRYEKILDSWVGVDVNRLFEAWGPPSSTFDMPDGRRQYTWLFDGGAVAMPIGNMAVAVRRGCMTTITTSTTGVIQTWRYEGNACRA
jgi:hypothetical protein